MDIDNMVIIVVGDAGKIKEELEFFGPVEVYDVNGKIIKTAAAKSEGTK
jgi:predicted amidohydrolase